MAGSSQRQGEMIQGINVTPLVDVVLVLLIAVMVTASYAVSRGIPMELPKAGTGESRSHPLAIDIARDGQLFVDGRPVSPSRLKSMLRQQREAGARSALIAADALTPHQNVVLVIDLLRRAEIRQFAINVSPSDSSEASQER